MVSHFARVPVTKIGSDSLLKHFNDSKIPLFNNLTTEEFKETLDMQ